MQRFVSSAASSSSGRAERPTTVSSLASSSAEQPACEAVQTTFDSSATGEPEPDNGETIVQCNWAQVTEPSEAQSIRSYDGSQLLLPLALRHDAEPVVSNASAAQPAHTDLAIEAPNNAAQPAPTDHEELNSDAARRDVMAAALATDLPEHQGFWVDGRRYIGFASSRPVFRPPSFFFIEQPALWIQCTCFRGCSRCVYDGATICEDCMDGCFNCEPGCCGGEEDTSDSCNEGAISE